MASLDLATSQQPIVNLVFSAKKPHAEFFASKNIYNILIKADSIESNIMESMSILMKSKSNKNVAEIFFTLIVNLSYFSPVRTFTYRAADTRAKPSIFTPDTKFNPSKALSQELSKLSSSKRVKLNYQLSPKQDRKLFETLSNQVFNETSSSDFDNGSFVASSQAEMITEPPNQSSHSSARKRQNSSFSNSFDYSSNAENNNKNNNFREEGKVEFNQNQNQNQQTNSINNNSDSNSDKFQVERINTPETKNSQSKLADFGKHSVRKPVSWRKGKKPDYLRSDKENEMDTKLPSLDESRSNDLFTIEPFVKDNQNQDQHHSDKKDQNGSEKDNSKEENVPELNKQNDKAKILSPIFDILNSPPPLSPRLPHLDHPKIQINSQQQKTDSNIATSISYSNEITDILSQNTDKEEGKKDKSEEIIHSEKEEDSDIKSEDSLKKEQEKESSKDGDSVVAVLSDDFDKSDEANSDSEKSSEQKSSKSWKTQSSSNGILSLDSDKKDDSDDKKDDSDDKKDDSDDKKDDSDDKKDDSDDAKDDSDDKKDETDGKKDDSDDKKDENTDKKDESSAKKDKSSESDDDDDDFF